MSEQGRSICDRGAYMHQQSPLKQCMHQMKAWLRMTFRAFAAASNTGSEAAASAGGFRPVSSTPAASSGGSGTLALGVAAGSEHAMLQMFVTSLHQCHRLEHHFQVTRTLKEVTLPTTYAAPIALGNHQLTCHWGTACGSRPAAACVPVSLQSHAAATALSLCAPHP